MTGAEIMARGREIYDRNLRQELESHASGRYVVLSVENGDYAVADSTTEAGAVMRSRYPDQVFYETRVGYDAVTLWPAHFFPDAARRA
jgi:hypothetical protein